MTKFERQYQSTRMTTSDFAATLILNDIRIARRFRREKLCRRPVVFFGNQ